MQLSQVGNILGGEKTLGKKLVSKMDLVDLGGMGVTKKAVSNLANYLSLSSKQVAELLPVTERTLHRYSSSQHLNQSVSEQVIHIAEVLAKGSEIFKEKNKLLLWLHTPSFFGQYPISFTQVEVWCGVGFGGIRSH